MPLCYSRPEEVDDGESLTDASAKHLSYVGKAAHDELSTKHQRQHHKLWNVTSGKVIGDLHHSPRFDTSPKSIHTHPPSDDDNWLPEKMAEILSKTRIWGDLMSLSPPDGLFMVEMKKALEVIHRNATDQENPVIVRMMFGNVLGMATNCDAVIKELTKDLPDDTNIRLWVGAWRKRASWNHAKLIAVDGKYLHTGGHNMWDPHYLRGNPVHDVSLEMEGRITKDGHLYANDQWAFIKRKQSSFIGAVIDKLPDNWTLPSITQVTVSEYPSKLADEFPPIFEKSFVPDYERNSTHVPVISIGRSGPLLFQKRPSDEAFIAMIDSAKHIIRLTLQDLGPLCIPGTKIALPGLKWPKPYLNAFARAIWKRGVDIEIVLSNPRSIPNGLSPLEGCYGNGWTCNDVASEIIKRIKKQFNNTNDAELRKMVTDNLRICYIRHGKTTNYPDGGNIGLHSKFFIIDDVATYIGSQNLYDCDLAEWGVLVDHVNETTKMKSDYWTPMWEASFTGEDCDVETVMDGLDIERDGKRVIAVPFMDRADAYAAARGNQLPPTNVNTNASFYEKHKATTDILVTHSRIEVTPSKD